MTRAREAKEAFGAKSTKFAGAVTVQILKSALAEEGIPTSPRDVFVQGIPVEIDLVVPLQGQEPALGLLYQAKQIAAALEIKKSGSYGARTLEKVRQDFGRFQEVGICCAYVTLEEQRNYRHAASAERLGFPCFTLAWHKITGGPIEPTEDWGSLLEFLRRCLERRAVGMEVLPT